jgi:solute carrier family 35 protein F5
MATSLLSLHLPAYYLHKYFKQRFSSPPEEKDPILYTAVKLREGNESDDENGSNTEITFSLFRKDHYEVVKIAAIICPLWFGANCFYNYSLLMTSVSSSTIISNLSASFTLAFSYFAGIEDASAIKIVGVIICFGGAVSVGLQDETSSNSGSIGGDVMALLGSAGYGLYTTAMKYKVPDDGQISMQLLLGYVGLINAIVLLPALLILFFLRLGHVNEITGEVVGFITLNGFADTVLADYFWARAVILTSPTVATIGMSVTIPIAILTDYILKGSKATWISILGAFFVVIGFILVNISPEWFEATIAKCWAGRNPTAVQTKEINVEHEVEHVIPS